MSIANSLLTLIHSHIDASTALLGLQSLTCACVGLAAHCGCGHCHDHDRDHDRDRDVDDEEDDEEEFGDDPFNINITRQQLMEYDSIIAQANERIEELVQALDAAAPGDRFETLDELTTLYLQRAAREHEEGEFDKAEDDYGAAFSFFFELFQENDLNLEATRRYAAGRLNYAIMLNDAGRLEEAEDAYEEAYEATERLLELGDRSALLDLAGTKLNLASVRFELGESARALNELDEVAEEFQKLVDGEMSQNPEARFYLAKTYSLKASLLVAKQGEEPDASETEEANDAFRRATEEYRILVDAGYAQYSRELAEELLKWAQHGEAKDREDLENRVRWLTEAIERFDGAVGVGETNSAGDLFDALLALGETLIALDRYEAAEKVYDRIIEAFDEYGNSDEIQLVDGVATARLERALLRKKNVSKEETLADLARAVELESRICVSITDSLSDKGCGCGEHGCGYERDEERECDHDGDHCHCGHDHCDCDHDECGCGCCEEDFGSARQFLIENWATENFNALCRAVYERVAIHLELGDREAARNDLVDARGARKLYDAALRDGESIESEWYDRILDVAASLE